MTGPEHKCGVVGIAAAYDVVSALQRSLMIIQHRGQESAGISVFDGSRIRTVKDNGLVQTALDHDSLADLRGCIGIGHVMYSTSGPQSVIDAQPFTVSSSFGSVAMSQNGDIVNYADLRKHYLSEGMSLLTDSDTELITNILVRHLAESKDPVRALKATVSETEASYALTVLINGRLFGIRDPYGLRPLCIGKLQEGHIIVSESAAIDALDGTFVRDVKPGEIVEITADDIISHGGPTDLKQKAHCMFEWVYFARPDSVIDGREVYDVRKRIGEILARESGIDVDIVIPIPDSGRAHAIGYSIQSNTPYEEGFMKNRFAERTFILPNQEDREAAVSTKMNPIRSTVEGKRLLIVDDSIVRGTTLKKLISMLREVGAKEVHVCVGSPPVIAPCYYGVDMKSRDQFIANKHSIDEICRIIGADSLNYISIDGLVEAIGKPKNELCLACVNAEYPTRIPGEKERFQSILNARFG
ncbi:MAG: amidophosphoribosyltransferase [Euryarchaeota archaeon]|jgi:amidophosphoribosyltransferase|nr:amidophosphoribosyltransferase [Euryarchaeota archaeon]